MEFTTRASGKELPEDVIARVYELRDVAERIVRAVKDIKHLRRNATRYTTRPQGSVTDLYNGLRTEIARILVELEKLDRLAPEDRSRLWLDEERIHIESDKRDTNHRIEALIRDERINATAATSFLNDSSYAYGAMRELIDAGRSYYVATDSAVAEVEKIFEIEEEDIETSP